MKFAPLRPTVLLLLLSAGIARAAAPLADNERVFILKDALTRTLTSGDTVKHDLTIHLPHHGNTLLGDAIGLAPDYLHSIFNGTVQRSPNNELLIRLQIPRAGGIHWGERSGVEGILTLTLDDKNNYTGTFRQTLRGRLIDNGPTYDIKGVAATRTIPLPVAPGFTPPAAGEHPRLFFRKADIPALRGKANTEFGKTLIARAEELLARNKNGFGWNHTGIMGSPYTEGTHAAGHAFLYIMKNDPAHAQRAKQLTFMAMGANGGEWGSWGNGLRMPGVAVAYDLCYDEWLKTDPAFLRKVGEWLQAASRGRGENFDMHFDGMFASAGGLAALAILNDPMEQPAAPVHPDKAPLITAPKNFDLPEGVPVQPFVEGQLARKWLVTGGFNPGYGGEPLTALGGPAAARPKPNDTYKQGDKEFAWKPLDTGATIGLYGFNPAGGNAKTQPREPFRADGAARIMSYFYTVLELDKPRTVMVELDTWGAFHGPDMPIYGGALWINGQPVAHKQIVRLEAGRYPVMYSLHFVNQMLVKPSLTEVTPERHQQLLADHPEDIAAWEAAGRSYPLAHARARRAAAFVAQYTQYSFDSKGFPSEDSTQADGIYNLLPYAAAFRNVMGRDLTDRPHLKQVLPNIVLTQRRFLRHDWGTAHFRALGFPAIADDTTRAIVQSELLATAEDNAITNSGSGFLSLPWDPLFALVNYDPKLKTTSRSDAKLTEFVHDEVSNSIAFTRSFAQQPEVQFLFLPRTSTPRGAITSGDFSLLWNGQLLTGYGNAGGGFFRPACLTKVERPNVIRIHNALPTRGAELLALDRPADQFLAATIRLANWVDGVADNPHGSPKISSPERLGISHTRSIAVDYANPAALAVLIVADHVRAPADRAAWLQVQKPNTMGNNDRGKVDLTPNSITHFFKGKPDAKDRGPKPSLRTTFFTTGELKIKATVDDTWEVASSEQRPPHFEPAAGPDLEKIPAKQPGKKKSESAEEVIEEAIKATTTKGAAQPVPQREIQFITVMTIQVGDVPEVAFAKDAFTVGTRTYVLKDHRLSIKK